MTGKRADGYHALQSLMVFADAGDTLEISPAPHLHLEVDGPFAAGLGAPEENLVWRAAELLAAHHKVPPGAHIRLTKNLPAASGLGGGSSDAAAALLGLARLWGLPEDPGSLLQAARTLGADVPACLHKKPLWAEGTGDEIALLPALPRFHFVLANPLLPTPTPQVFRNFRSPFSAPVPAPAGLRSADDWLEWLKAGRNDLTEAAIAVTPSIRDVLTALAGTGDCRLSRLSGSGATCFGIYGDAKAAQAAAATLRKSHAGWWVAAAGMFV